MAHKKAAGSAKNLRDSQPKYRGVKLFGGQKALAGNIIIRQKGSQYECGENTYLAADFTIHALVDGVVVFKKKNFKRFDGRTYLKTVVTVLPGTPSASSQVSPKKTTTKTAEKALKTEKKAVSTVVTEPVAEPKEEMISSEAKPSKTVKKTSSKKGDETGTTKETSAKKATTVKKSASAKKGSEANKKENIA